MELRWQLHEAVDSPNPEGCVRHPNIMAGDWPTVEDTSGAEESDCGTKMTPRAHLFASARMTSSAGLVLGSSGQRLCKAMWKSSSSSCNRSFL
jgi:hypothetical protein